MLLREKRSGYLSEIERLTRFLEEARVCRSAAEHELAEAQETAEKAKAESVKAEKLRGDLEISYTQRVNKRNDLRKKIDTLMSEQRALVHRQETAQATQQALRENLSERRARAQVIDAHVADAAERLSTAKAQSETLEAQASRLEGDLTRAREEEASTREKLNALVVARDGARRALDEARTALTKSTAERAALEELERSSESSNPAQAKMMEETQALTSDYSLVSHAVSAPAGLDMLVEALLGSELQAVLVSNDADAERLVSAVANSDAVGSVAALTPVSKESGSSPCLGQRRLVDELDIDPRFLSQVRGLIGDVFIVNTISDAISCARNAQGATSRFASLDGCVASTDGKLSFVRFTEADKQNNALARRRALAQVIKEEERCRANYEAAQSEDGRVETELRQAQTASLKLSESLANLKGQSESARRDADASARALQQLEGEHQRLIKEQEENIAFFEKAQPDSDELERTLLQVTADLN